MIVDGDALYALLPAVYRERDAALGIDGGPGPLRDIVGVVADQLALVDAEVDRLYDDAFIETCAAWVVPYIGDLIGYLPLSATVPGVMSPRAEVANTIRYRRWKGTATILEQVASDVTGWSAVAVEFFQRLTTTQFVNHVRPASFETVNVRDWQSASSAGSPFDRNSHTVEVRRIATGRGKYNIPNIGVYVWRLAVYADRGAPSQAFSIDGNRFTFDPLGFDAPLYNVPPLDRVPFTRTRPQDVPAPLARRVVADPATRSQYLGVTPVFVVHDAGGAAIPAANVDICDLSAWATTPPALTGGYQVAVDPQLGRIWLPGATTTPILVEYAYGFSGPYGAGFQHRTPDPTPVTTTIARDPVSLEPSIPLVTAIGSAPAPHATIVILYQDSVTDTSTTAVTVGDGETLVVRADDFRRPVLSGPLEITVAVDAGSVATVVLDGLLLATGLIVSGSGTMHLTIRNATIRPAAGAGAPAISWSGANGTLTLERSLCGPIVLDENVDPSIADSIVDAAGGAALSGGALTLARTTVYGTLAVREVVLIENAIVTATATSKRRQAGCVRFSYLTLDSLVPQRYRCQPDTAIRSALVAATLADPALSAAQEAALSADIASAVVPQFTGDAYGDPAYGQLSSVCPAEIAAGADDDGEMGVFHDLFTALREKNLGIRLAEYIRLGLEAGVLHA